MVDFILPIVVVLVSGTSVVGVYLQGRASRAVGVREADVQERRDSGEMALEIARDLRGEAIRDRERIGQLESVNAELARDVQSFRDAVNDAARALDELADWEAAGAEPPAPHRVSNIARRLKRAIGKENE